MPFSSVTDSPAASTPSLLLPLLGVGLHLTAATAEWEAHSARVTSAAAAPAGTLAATTGRTTTPAAEAAVGVGASVACGQEELQELK